MRLPLTTGAWVTSSVDKIGASIGKVTAGRRLVLASRAQRQRNLSLVAEAGPGLHRTFRSQRSASNALPGSDVARPATERSLAADPRGQRPSTISLGTEWSVVSDVAAERPAASAHAAKRRVPLKFIENLRSRRTRLFRWATTERLSRSSGSASISKLTCRAAPSSCRNSTTKPHSPQ